MRNSLLSEDAKVRLKGKLIFIALSVFTIGAILDSVFSLNALTVVITRLILTTSALISYIGWIMPDRIAKILIKK